MSEARAVDDPIGELDAMDADAVEAVLAPLFEGAPRFLARLVAARPFGSWPGVFERAREIAHAMPEAEQVELLDAHPRLGAPRDVVSGHSFREQGYDQFPERQARAGAHWDAGATLLELNVAYEARFGFRYCVFVAGRPLASLLPAFAATLDAGDRTGELHRGLDAVVDIARARHGAALYYGQHGSR